MGKEKGKGGSERGEEELREEGESSEKWGRVSCCEGGHDVQFRADEGETLPR